jgi:peroxiredoxin
MRRLNGSWRWLLTAALACAAAAVPAADYPLLGQPAPDFALRAFAGPNVRLSESRGDVAVITFWSSRCGTCRDHLETLGRALHTYGSAGLVVLGVAVDDDANRAREFAQYVPVGLPMLADPAKTVSRLYRVDALPLTVLVDRAGRVRHVHHDFGTRGEEEFLKQLRVLLNE